MALPLELWQEIDDTAPHVDIEGPYGNTFRIFVTDKDGDVIALLPQEALDLVRQLKEAVASIKEERAARRRMKK